MYLAPLISNSQAPLAIFASFSGTGGVERMLINLIRGLVNLNQPIEILLTRTRSPYLDALPPQVTQVDLQISQSLLAIPALARYLRHRRPAALLVAKDRAGQAAVLARALACIDIPILLRLGTNLSAAMKHHTQLERWLRYAPQRLLYPKIDQIIAVSEGVAEDIAQTAQLPRSRIQVIRNPVITSELYLQAAEPCSHPWFALNQPPVILGCGRLQQQKDFITLIQAFAQLKSKRNYRLMILGEGRERSRLTSLITKLDLNEWISLPGFQSNPYKFLARAALFVLTSRWEGSPNVLTEALALGIPVIATDCPSGPAETLAGGRYGTLVPIGDVNQLTQAMSATLVHPLPAHYLKSAVIEYEQNHSAKAYLQLIKNLK